MTRKLIIAVWRSCWRHWNCCLLANQISSQIPHNQHVIWNGQKVWWWLRCLFINEIDKYFIKPITKVCTEILGINNDIGINKDIVLARMTGIYIMQTPYIWRYYSVWPHLTVTNEIMMHDVRDVVNYNGLKITEWPALQTYSVTKSLFYKLKPKYLQLPLTLHWS